MNGDGQKSWRRKGSISAQKPFGNSKQLLVRFLTSAWVVLCIGVRVLSVDDEKEGEKTDYYTVRFTTKREMRGLKWDSPSIIFWAFRLVNTAKQVSLEPHGLLHSNPTQMPFCVVIYLLV